jgi:hypothetical protein
LNETPVPGTKSPAALPTLTGQTHQMQSNNFRGQSNKQPLNWDKFTFQHIPATDQCFGERWIGHRAQPGETIIPPPDDPNIEWSYDWLSDLITGELPRASKRIYTFNEDPVTHVWTGRRATPGEKVNPAPDNVDFDYDAANDTWIGKEGFLYDDGE